MFLQVRQFIEMVSGADSLEIESESGGGKSWADTSSSSGHSGSNMDMEEQVDNAGGDVGNHENHQTEQAVNGNSQNTSNGNVDCEHSTDNMDVDAAGPRANSILANPARFECLIR